MPHRKMNIKKKMHNRKIEKKNRKIECTEKIQKGREKLREVVWCKHWWTTERKFCTHPF